MNSWFLAAKWRLGPCIIHVTMRFKTNRFCDVTQDCGEASLGHLGLPRPGRTAIAQRQLVLIFDVKLLAEDLLKIYKSS